MLQLGRFITVEGGEGVGKSLFIKNLASFLRSTTFDSIVTREPGGTPIADEIRHIFVSPPAGDKIHMHTELLMVLAARSQHVQQLIRPTLATGRWVLCDRYSDSTRVYQGIVGGIDPYILEQLIKFATDGLEPDVTFLLDCSVESALARLKERVLSSGNTAQLSRYDKADVKFHESVRAGYQKLQGMFPQRIFVLDASREPQHVLNQAVQILKDQLAVKC